jgi:hypothetical protein
MDEILGPLAFALLIGGQFLAAIVLSSKRKTIHADPRAQVHKAVHATDGYPKSSTCHRSTMPATINVSVL